MTSIVAIDIETTGLDENREAILEIGAVKFKGHRIEDEFTTLLNPNRHIPEFIIGLTCIDDAMIRQTPHLCDNPRICQSDWLDGFTSDVSSATRVARQLLP